MYQILLMTNDNSKQTFAANIPNNKLDYIIEYLSEFGHYLRFGVDIYDDKISAKEYEGYGKFHDEKALKVWLYEKVFHGSFGSLSEFTQWYDSLFAERERRRKLEDVCTDILYEDYRTGKNTMDVWRKICIKVDDIIEDEHITRYTPAALRPIIRRGMVDYILEATL